MRAGSGSCICFRAKNIGREVFHTGELTVSPASIDFCGIFVVPLAQDFERITGDAIAAIFREVTLPDDQFQEVARKLESER